MQCQTSKVGRHTESGVGEFPQPKRRFGHIHVDVVEPLPPSGGARYLQTVVDRSTIWPKATPMEEANSSACTEALLSSWISRTTTYNPAANRMVERFYRSLKASLLAHCSAENWKYQLPWVLLRLRTFPRANGSPSSAEKVYGETLVVPGELVTENRDDIGIQRLRNKVGKFTPCQRTFTDRTSPLCPPRCPPPPTSSSGTTPYTHP
ncbi:uncharacterized protein [Macrobrachium rosenbergii]|uniref:uncharacterized protein n=1 Tax=Macrobrachium rosenbergii TaxID=79674 RepID=UPI0034D42442